MSVHKVDGEVFAVKDGCCTVTEFAAWMGASITLVHDAVINGEIVSVQRQDGIRLIPLDFVELMLEGGSDHENFD